MNEVWTPADEGMEKHVLGGILFDVETASCALEELKPLDFFLAKHTALFEAMGEMYAQNIRIDLLSLRAYLEKTGRLAAAGGWEYIREMEAEVVSAVPVPGYLPVIKDHALRRRLIHGGRTLLGRACEASNPTPELVAEGETLLLELAERQVAQGVRTHDQCLPETLLQMAKITAGQITGIPTGLTDMDRVTGGFQPTDLIIIGGRPAMGKTSLGLTIAWRSAFYHKKRVAFFSLEMGREQLQQRYLCAYRNVDLHKLRTGKLEKEDLVRIDEAVRDMAGLSLSIDDSSRKTALQILSQCKRLKRSPGLDMVVVDYIQLGSADKEDSNREQEVAAFTRGLKAMAKDLHIPVVALAQLNRKVEERLVKEPTMADLRESGEIENSADIVILLHRAHYYDPTAEEALAKAIIAKYRNGPTGAIKIRFNKESASFTDYIEPSIMEGMPDANRTKPAAAQPARRYPPRHYQPHQGHGGPHPRGPMPGEAGWND